MPQGIVAEVDGGFATIDFVDPKLRGPGLNRLLEIGGPATIETLTRVKNSPRRQYRVPEGNAREAGLLDTPRGLGLNVDGTPDDDTSGGTGTTTDTGTAGDTGFAAALVAADPNVNPGLDKENWHTPTAEYTSANSFVATDANDASVDGSPVLNGRPQIFTGVGDVSADSNLTHPLSSSDLIAYVADNGNGLTRSEAVREPRVPAAHISGALSQQTAALGSDPGGYAKQPESPVEAASLVSGAVVSPFANGPTPAPAGPATPRPAHLPEGDPNVGWKRADINAYAEWWGVAGAADLSSKADVLNAITKAS